jgi:hypothetical protein
MNIEELVDRIAKEVTNTPELGEGDLRVFCKFAARFLAAYLAEQGGMVLVPRAPTEAMRKAMKELESGDFSFAGGWEHLIAAATSPPTAPEVPS